jgi:F420-dependent oxidoreductase-like protein
VRNRIKRRLRSGRSWKKLDLHPRSSGLKIGSPAADTGSCPADTESQGGGRLRYVAPMRIGLFSSPSSMDAFVESAHQAAEEGYADVWVPQIFGLDALIAISVAAREVPGIKFGTGVIPTYPRHPMALAQQALTAQAATGGRLTLGIGLSHKPVIEGMYGMSFDRPAVHMRDYLSILLPLVRKQKVSYKGETLTGRGQLDVPGSEDMPVLIAAMAPRMLELAGSQADGTVLWMTGPRTTAEHVIPTMTAAAEKAGRPKPTTVAGLPMCLTSDPGAARVRAAKEYEVYGQLPSYRAMLDREGLAGPADLAVVGDEKALRAGAVAMAEAGADMLMVSCFGSVDERAATRAFMAGIASEGL